VKHLAEPNYRYVTPVHMCYYILVIVSVSITMYAKQLMGTLFNWCYCCFISFLILHVNLLLHMHVQLLRGWQRPPVLISTYIILLLLKLIGTA